MAPSGGPWLVLTSGDHPFPEWLPLPPLDCVAPARDHLTLFENASP